MKAKKQITKDFFLLLLLSGLLMIVYSCGNQNSLPADEKTDPAKPNDPTSKLPEVECLESKLQMIKAPPVNLGDFINRMNSNYEICNVTKEGTKSYLIEVKKQHPNLYAYWSHHEIK
jgi:hypothetical protein